jgi:hypothetical protein
VLGNVDIHFSLILVTKASADERETMSAVWLYHQHNQFMYVTDCMTVMSLSAIHQHKTSDATNHQYQIVLHWKLLHIVNSTSH